jgi:hypothetical protein
MKNLMLKASLIEGRNKALGSTIKIPYLHTLVREKRGREGRGKLHREGQEREPGFFGV